MIFFFTQDMFYSDTQRWSYLFESYALLTMMEIHCQPHVSEVSQHIKRPIHKKELKMSCIIQSEMVNH